MEKDLESSGPPKVRVFMWKLLKGILPTKVTLAKKIMIPNINCVFCHNHAESDVHLFMRCPALNCFWSACALGLHTNNHNGSNIVEWFLEASSCLLINQVDVLCMCLWVIWIERNNMVWNGGYFNAVHMARWVSTTLGEYQKHHPLRTKKQHRTISHWEQPPSGRLKINVDGSFLGELEQGSIGVVARDNLGNCMAALSRSLNHVASAIHAEAEACRAGLLLAIHQGWDDLIMETDCAMLVDALAGSGDDFSQIGRIVGDCKEYLYSFNSFEIRHVY